MRNWVPFIAVGLTIVLSAIALEEIAQRDLHALKTMHAHLPQSDLTPDQLETFIDKEDGRRVASVLIGAAARATYERDADALIRQQRALDMIQNRSLSKFLLPNEFGWMISQRSFYCEVLYGQDRFSDVLSQAERILSLVPNNPEGLLWKGIALGRLGTPDEAATLIEQAIAASPDSAFILTHAAHYYFYWSPGRAWKEKALPLVQRALELAPRDELALRLMADYWVDKKQCSNALPFAEKGVAMHPDSAGAWGMIGNVQWCLADLTNAKASYRHAIELSPSLEPIYREKLATP